MQHLVDSTRQAVRDQNWYAALTLALTLPDIAAKLDGRAGGSERRYVSWFDDYLAANYRDQLLEANECYADQMFEGGDCYALRCAYLHEGDFDFSDHRARNALERIHFVVMLPGEVFHCNLWDDTKLYLQVDLFCEEVCLAVEKWLSARGQDPIVAAAIAQLPRFEIIQGFRRMRLSGPEFIKPGDPDS